MFHKQTRILGNPYGKVHDAIGRPVAEPLRILSKSKVRQ
jgi:hypothetical protein